MPLQCNKERTWPKCPFRGGLEIDPPKGTVENDEMLPLLFAMIVFFFLLLGSLVFVVCILAPQTRRFALSAALWCALWGPC